MPPTRPSSTNTTPYIIQPTTHRTTGDAFLLTWKVTSQQTASGEGGNYAADKALYAFVKTMIEMTKHEDFLCNFSPWALSALFERMPGYKCRIGCGLHFGSAIEGAIGSAKKIYATFFSHHVNMSETLESSMKEYGVSILMSQPFYELLSPEASNHQSSMLGRSASNPIVS